MSKEKSQKQLQVAEQIRREIASTFLRDNIFKDNSFKVTVYEADISPDLKNAKIFLGVFGEVDRVALVNDLNKNQHYFRQKLAKTLRLKNIPHILFVLDSSADAAIHISKVLEEEGKKIS